MPDWLESLLDAVDKFVVTPKERLEYEAQIARAKADESLAAAQLAAAASHQNQMLTTGLMIAAIGGVGLLVFNMMKD